MFFNVCNNDYASFLIPGTIIFPSDVLSKYEWWTNTRQSMGPTAESNKYPKYTVDIDSILRKLYRNSLKVWCAPGRKYDSYTSEFCMVFTLSQEVFIKKSISLDNAIAVVVSSDFDTTLLKKKYPAIKIVVGKKYYKCVDMMAKNKAKYMAT